MKRIYSLKTWIVVCSLALSGVFMQGCVADDLSVCGVTLHFKYTRNSEGIDKFSSSINKINLYVFDQDSVLVNKYEFEQSRFPENFSVYLNVPSGNYHFVAWGNLKNDYEVETDSLAGTSLRARDLGLKYKHIGDTITSIPNDLYYGSVNLHISPEDLKLQRGDDYIIDMMKNTKYIKVTARGLAIDRTRAAGTMYDCIISSINGKLRFDNNTTGIGRLQYTQKAEVVAAEEDDEPHLLVSDFTLVRELADGATLPNLLFTRNEYGIKSTMLDIPIYPLLLAAALRADMNFDHKESFDIELIFDDTYATPTIVVDGWAEAGIGGPVY